MPPRTEEQRRAHRAAMRQGRELGRAGLRLDLEVVNDRGTKVARPIGGGSPVPKAAIAQRLTHSEVYLTSLQEKIAALQAAETALVSKRAEVQDIHDRIDE